MAGLYHVQSIKYWHNVSSYFSYQQYEEYSYENDFCQNWIISEIGSSWPRTPSRGTDFTQNSILAKGLKNSITMSNFWFFKPKIFIFSKIQKIWIFSKIKIFEKSKIRHSNRIFSWSPEILPRRYWEIPEPQNKNSITMSNFCHFWQKISFFLKNEKISCFLKKWKNLAKNQKFDIVIEFLNPLPSIEFKSPNSAMVLKIKNSITMSNFWFFKNFSFLKIEKIKIFSKMKIFEKFWKNSITMSKKPFWEHAFV